MATFTTYSTLVSDITSYIERGASAQTDETVHDQIPRLINLAERKICQDLKLLGQIEALTDPSGLPAGVAVITKPDRWRETVSMWYGAGASNSHRKPLFPRSYEYLRTYWPNDSVTDADNPPGFYADYDLQHWLIAPTPDQTYPLEVLCYMQPPLLDQTNQTNFWTDYTPALLLYSALLETAPFLKDDDRLQVWGQLKQDQMQSLNSQDLQRLLDRSAVRQRP